MTLSHTHRSALLFTFSLLSPALVSSAAVDASALLISSPPSTSLRYFAASTLNATASDRPPECPPCLCVASFLSLVHDSIDDPALAHSDCTKPRFGCLQYGQCNEYDGQCRCPEGFGGEDCSKPRALAPRFRLEVSAAQRHAQSVAHWRMAARDMRGMERIASVKKGGRV